MDTTLGSTITKGSWLSPARSQVARSLLLFVLQLSHHRLPCADHGTGALGPLGPMADLAQRREGWVGWSPQPDTNWSSHKSPKDQAINSVSKPIILGVPLVLIWGLSSYHHPKVVVEKSAVWGILKTSNCFSILGDSHELVQSRCLYLLQKLYKKKKIKSLCPQKDMWGYSPAWNDHADSGFLKPRLCFHKRLRTRNNSARPTTKQCLMLRTGNGKHAELSLYVSSGYGWFTNQHWLTMVVVRGYHLLIGHGHDWVAAKMINGY